MNRETFVSDSGKWGRETSRFIASVFPTAPGVAKTCVAFGDFAKLPEPVARYLTFALSEGQPLIDAARITQAGTIKTGRWFPFTAEQYFSTDPPAFLWNANVRMAGLITMKVRDAYLGGKGSMEAKLFGMLPFLHQRDSFEINAGALQRYLAECIWFPSALLPSERLSWYAIGRNRAVAQLKDREIEVSLEFQFNDKGEVVEIFSPGRYRYANGKYVLTPWRGTVGRYKEVKGMKVPTHAEIAWILPEGHVSYFKGDITNIELNEEVRKRFSFGACCCEDVCS